MAHLALTRATVLSSKEISSPLNLSLSLSHSFSLSFSRERWNYAEVPRLETNSFSSAKLALVVPPRHGGINFWNSLIVVSVVWKVVGCQVESSRRHCRTKRGEGEESVFLLFLRQFEPEISKFEVKKRMKACLLIEKAVDPLGEGLRFKWPPTPDPRQPSPIRRAGQIARCRVLRRANISRRERACLSIAISLFPFLFYILQPPPARATIFQRRCRMVSQPPFLLEDRIPAASSWRRIHSETR